MCGSSKGGGGFGSYGNTKAGRRARDVARGIGGGIDGCKSLMDISRGIRDREAREAREAGGSATETVKAVEVATTPLSPESQLGQTNKAKGRLMQKRQATVTTPVLAGRPNTPGVSLGGKPGLGATGLTRASKSLSFEAAAKKSSSPSLSLAAKGHVSIDRSSPTNEGSDFTDRKSGYLWSLKKLDEYGEISVPKGLEWEKGKFKGGQPTWNPDRGLGRVRDAVVLGDDETRSMTSKTARSIAKKAGYANTGILAKQLSEGNAYFAGNERKHDNTGQFLDKAAVVADVLGAGAGIFMGSPPIVSIIQGVRHYNQMKDNQGDINALVAAGVLPEKTKNSLTGRVLTSLHKSRQRLAGRSQTQTTAKGLGTSTPSAPSTPEPTPTKPRQRVLMRDRKRKTSGFDDYYVLVQRLLGAKGINYAKGIYG